MNKKFTKLMAALALLTFLAVPMGMWGQITIDFEDNQIPSGWTNTNDMAVVSNPISNTGTTNGSYCLSTNGKASNSLTSGFIENIVSISVDATRTSNNTTNEVYIDFCPNTSFGASDTQSKSVTVNKESWSTSTLTLSNTASGYVRIRRSGGNSTATKFIDNIVITVGSSGPTYTLEQYSLPTNAHGTITFSPSTTVQEGAEVTLTATPAGGYDFVADSWAFYKECAAGYEVDGSITVTNNKFNMPAYNLWVEATFVGKEASFTNGVYSEPLDTQDSFDNMIVIDANNNDNSWFLEVASDYSCATISGVAGDEDWLITPKMAVENGKIAISFSIWHDQDNQNQLSVKWSTSNAVSGTWNTLTFDEGSGGETHVIPNIEIATEAEYIYMAFVYASSEAGEYSIMDFFARQYYDLTFDANGGTGTMATQNLAAGDVTLPACTYTYQGKAFRCWNTEVGGTGTDYAAGATYTLTGDATLYAQWDNVYTVSFTTNGIADGTRQVAQGQAIGTLPEATAAYIPAGYTFVGWYNGEDITEPVPTSPTCITSAYPVNSNLTLKAVFAMASGSGSSDTYALVSDDNDLHDGDIIILVSTGSYNYSNTTYYFTVANGTVNASKLMDPVDVTISTENNENKVTSTNVAPITLVEVTGGWKLQMGTKYLDTVKGKNLIELDDIGAINTIEIDNSIATIGGITDGTDTRIISYNPNNGNGRFAYYKSTQKAISIYKQESSVTYSNYRTSLTQEYSIHIDKHGANGQGGWYLISSPLAGTTAVSDVTNLINTDLQHFDLYRYNQSATKEWENWKNNGSLNRFNLESGKGYLYANDSNEEGVTLIFSGAPYNGDGQIALTYDENAELPGWNLIGNPFGTAATLDLPYYQMNAARTALGAKVEGEEIAAMEGVFVYAYDQTASQTIATATFTPAGRSANTPQGIVNLNVENNGSVIDNAIVRFNEGYTLPKFYFGNPNANLYIPQGEKEYAIATSEGQGEMPLNFRANTDGQYVLTVNPEGVEMNYLHLVDNMTGNDVDLLATPSYSFNATTRDYESRFRLVFAANNEDGVSASSTTFAFYSNGNWMVNNEGEASLQVIDVMGRVLSNQTISGTAELSLNQQPGVYVLRLVNGNDVKTQKIVVR